MVEDGWKPKEQPTKTKNKNADRFGVLNAFIDFTLVELSRAQITVWMILYRDTRDGTARTSMSDIARRAGCARRNVVRAVRQLEARGLIEVVHRGGFRRGTSRYRVKPLAKDD
jgi:DNA-binding MarR family transcriptional regulator